MFYWFVNDILFSEFVSFSNDFFNVQVYNVLLFTLRYYKLFWLHQWDIRTKKYFPLILTFFQPIFQEWYLDHMRNAFWMDICIALNVWDTIPKQKSTLYLQESFMIGISVFILSAATINTSSFGEISDALKLPYFSMEPFRRKEYFLFLN